MTATLLAATRLLFAVGRGVFRPWDDFTLKHPNFDAENAVEGRRLRIDLARNRAHGGALARGMDVHQTTASNLVRVLVRKPGALRAQGVEWAGVEITRRRGG